MLKRPALEYLTQTLDGYREVHDRHGEVVTLVNLARVHHRNNALAAARTASGSAKALCEEYDFPHEARSGNHPLRMMPPSAAVPRILQRSSPTQTCTLTTGGNLVAADERYRISGRSRDG